MPRKRDDASLTLNAKLTSPLPKDLLEPIVLPRDIHPLKIETLEELSKRHQEYRKRVASVVVPERLRKFALLFERYKIDMRAPDAWMILANALANELLSGFHTKEENINISIWNDFTYALFWYDVTNQQRKRRARSEREACNRLRADQFWQLIFSRKRRFLNKDGLPSLKAFTNKFAEAKDSVLVKKVCTLISAGVITQEQIKKIMTSNANIVFQLTGLSHPLAQRKLP